MTPLCPHLHLRQVQVSDISPKYDMEIIYADSIFMIVGFGGDLARHCLLAGESEICGKILSK